MTSNSSKNIALSIIIVSFIAIIFITVKALYIVDRTQVGTKDGIYTNHVSTSEEIRQKAFALTKNCKNEICQVQSILEYVTHIPYKINLFKAHSPQKTIKNRFGDCDDKSNLLISMLHALDKEAYFVLVPKHIFVIVAIKEPLPDRKGLWIDGKKYYILESTAKDSSIGYPLHYALTDIQAIIEPFSNRKLDYDTLEYGF